MISPFRTGYKSILIPLGMIISRHHFELKGKCVIEKVVIKTPFRFGAIFQKEACFIYFKNNNTRLNSPTQQINIHANEGVLLKCGSYFIDFIENASSGASEIFAIHLYPEILKEIYKNEIPAFLKSSDNQEYARKVIGHKVIGQFIETLGFYFDNPDLVDDELLTLKLKELILLLLKTKSAETIVNLIAHLFTPRRATLNEVISTLFFSGLSIEELAKLSGLSLSSFKREFQKIYNDTPANYIKAERLKKAGELLLISGFSISEIAFQVGFRDLAHFSRSFSAKYKCSPSEYRQLNKN